MWSNGLLNEDLSNITPGTYFVLVTDSNGCQDAIEVDITEPSPLQMSYEFFDSDCGFDNGSIDVTVLGGTPPYNYSWSNGFTSEDVIDLAPGLYDLIIEDANNCSLNFSQNIVNIEDPPNLWANNTDNCQLTTNLMAYTNDYSPGPWLYIGLGGSSVILDDPFSAATLVTVEEYGTYAFQFTACNTIDTVLVTFLCPPITVSYTHLRAHET